MNPEQIEEKLRERLHIIDAHLIKFLRKTCSWRKVAKYCHELEVAGAFWSPPQDQLAGRALCKVASKMLGENVDDQIDLEEEEKKP